MGFNGLRVAVAVCAVAALSGAAKQANANITYVLQNVILNGGGTLTGSFTTNDARNSLVSTNIVASANLPTYPGFTYTGTTFVNTAALQVNQSGNFLQFAFTGGLTTSGATLTPGVPGGGGSFESEASARRDVVSGSVVAAVAPEPSSLPIFMSGGLCGLGMVVRRRRKATV